MYYAILRKQEMLPIPEYSVISHLPDLTIFDGQPVAFDFETHGLNPITGSIRSVAITNDAGSVAIDMEALTDAERSHLLLWLVHHPLGLIAHNAVFDVSWLYHATGIMPKIETCTLVLFRLLATEGWLGQKWGLKSAMTDVLGWAHSNEEALYGWLKSKKLKTGDMAQAPWKILGKYNALDAIGCWQLYKTLSNIAISNGWKESVLDFHREDFCNLIELLVEQQISGMSIDLAGVNKYDQVLAEQIEGHRVEFLEHSEVEEHVTYYQRVLVEEMRLKEPPEFTKLGKPTSRHSKWRDRIEELTHRLDFNIDSPTQLQWLFFERLFYMSPIVTDKGGQSVGSKALPHLGELGKMLKGYRALRDRRKFVTALLNVQQGGILYPDVKCHGTVTGRPSGGKE